MALRIFKYSGIFLLLQFSSTLALAAENKNELCKRSLSNELVHKVFKQSALNQLGLEFGKTGTFVYDVMLAPVDADLVRVESFARYQKMGQKEPSRMRIKAWVSRCSGTTIIRGNTWLSDGTLKVERFSAQEIRGRGLHWGSKDAPMRFIIYVDSRCPHCHRLIEYAKSLIKEGKVFLDVRQVAYLEEKEEALLDTQLPLTSLIANGISVKVDEGSYLDMLAGNNSVNLLDNKSESYQRAMKFISENTETAEKLLHIITVPAVYIQEKDHDNRYRRMGYWEVNRIFQ